MQDASPTAFWWHEKDQSFCLILSKRIDIDNTLQIVLIIESDWGTNTKKTQISKTKSLPVRHSTLILPMIYKRSNRLLTFTSKPISEIPIQPIVIRNPKRWHKFRFVYRRGCVQLVLLLKYWTWLSCSSKIFNTSVRSQLFRLHRIYFLSYHIISAKPVSWKHLP